MTHLGENEQKLVSRYVDGDLSGDELAAVETRLLRDRRLREAVDEQRAVRGWFARARGAEGRAPAARVPAGFAGRVLDRVRRLPDREELLAEAGELGERERAERSTVALGRAILAAAALIFALALPIAGGLVPRLGTHRLEAADRHELERIDRELRVLAGASDTRGPTPEDERGR